MEIFQYLQNILYLCTLKAVGRLVAAPLGGEESPGNKGHPTC